MTHGAPLVTVRPNTVINHIQSMDLYFKLLYRARLFSDLLHGLTGKQCSRSPEAKKRKTHATEQPREGRCSYTGPLQEIPWIDGG